MGVPLEGFAELCRIVAAQGCVLLKNKDRVLPLEKGEKISVFGRMQIDYYRSGTGSGGAVNVPYKVNFIDGLLNGNRVCINEDLLAVYKNWIGQNPFDYGGGGWAAEPWHQTEMPLEGKIVREAALFSNKAIVVIGRTSGEDKDNAKQLGSYLLTLEEENMLKNVTTYFENVIVILNTTNIIDMNWLTNHKYKGHIKSVLYSWCGGMEGGNAIADVITGLVTPSGKLPDTIAYEWKDYPSTANYGDKQQVFYKEDIYVGYRYFETFCPEKVQFEFGFGLSYTEFSIEQVKGSLRKVNGDTIIEVTIKVENIGNYFKGKEVVQIYCQAPQGKLGKPSKVLVAFEKTRLLEVGEREEFILKIPIKRLASYDDSGITGNKSCLVLEEGDYKFFVGNSVRNNKPLKIDCGEFHYQDLYYQEKTEVIEQLQEVLAPTEQYDRIKPGKSKENGTYQIESEQVPTKTILLMKRITENRPDNLVQTGNVGIRLKDVHDKNATIEQFIAQLSKEELATIVRAEGMCSPKVTPGTAGAFGGVGDSLYEYGIPIACAADGPSGIRMDNGYQATQLPIGTLLASTWDTGLVKKLYELEGQELLRNRIDTLLGPGINIHRNPLNGRNFEYFSEDPFLTGEFAAAITLGIGRSGAKATVKHFACNNQETARDKVDIIVSERALREIYLKGFEMAVKDGEAKSIMTSYNAVNGFKAASNYDLTTTILRKEWGFEGIVMTDWWAKLNDVILGGQDNAEDTRSMIKAQNDLYMVVNSNGAEINALNDNTLESLRNGSLEIGELQRCAMNICRFLMEIPAFNREKKKIALKHIGSKKSNGIIHENFENVELLRPTYKVIPIEETLTTFIVEISGIYRVTIEVMSEDTKMAQLICNGYLNDEIFATIQTNGTDGKWIQQKQQSIQLDAGLYEMNLKHVKPGLQVGWIEFLYVGKRE